MNLSDAAPVACIFWPALWTLITSLGIDVRAFLQQLRILAKMTLLRRDELDAQWLIHFSHPHQRSAA